MQLAVTENQQGGPFGELPPGEVCLAILNQIPVGVTVAEVPGGAFLWHNDAAERILGHGAIPAANAEDYRRYGARHEDGTPYEPGEYPLVRAVFDGEVIEREPMYYRRRDGRLITLEVNAIRLTGLHGRQLGVSTFQDVTAEYDSERALKEAAERVQLALDAGAIVGTWVWNVAEDTITADELFARSLGLDPERCRTGLPSQEVFASVHPADRAGVEATVAEAIARGGRYRHQYRVLQDDGAYRWVEASGRVEMDESGAPIRFPGVLLDIAAWKQAEEARNLLMREVDHRARNALAVVQSVVRLTDASDPARYRDEVIGRIDAMARAQGSLSSSNWLGGALEDLIRQELSSYASPDRFALAGPKVTLPAEQVQPFSMIMHEMATNAVKHGALSVPDGEVEVSWTAGRRGDVELTWKEAGGPMVEPPRREGFGSRLIPRLATQLGGPLVMDWRPTGLEARLRWRL
jgi:two-component sensor histidine kinase